MSLSLRIIRHGRFLSVFRCLGLLSRRNFNLSEVSLASSSCPLSFNKIRTYTVQKPENVEVLNDKLKSNNELNTEFHQADLILKQGGLLYPNVVEELYDKMKISNVSAVTPFQTLFLLRCCGSATLLANGERRNKLLLKIWNTYQERGFPLDISHYNALLQVCLENEHKFSPMDFLATLEEKKIELNQITYSRLIARFCQEGDIDGASKILEFMKEKKMPIGEKVFSSLIIGNSRANDLEGAYGIIEVMKNSDLTPGSEAYAALLQAHAEHQDIESINKLFLKCEQEEIYLHEKDLMNIICSLADKGLIQPIHEILSNLKNKHAHQQLAIFAVKHLIFNGHWKLSLEILKSLNVSEYQQHMWPFFPKELAASDLDLNQVVNYCEEIYNRGWNILVFELVLESYLREGKFDMALSFLQVMKEKDIPIKEHYFYPLFVNVAKDNDREKVLGLLEEMIRLKVVVVDTDFVFSYLLPSLNPSGDLRDFKAIYSRLMTYQADVSIDILYNGMMEYLLKNQGLKLAAQFVTVYRRGVRWSMKPILGELFLRTYNVSDTVCILYQMLPLSVRLSKGDVEENVKGYEGIRDFLNFVIIRLKRENTIDEHLLPLLREMKIKGVGIHSSMVDEIANQIENVNPEVQKVLNSLSDPTFRRNSHQYPSEGSLPQMPDESNLREGMTSDRRINYLVTLIRERRIIEVEELINNLKLDGVSVPPPVQVLLLNMYMDKDEFTNAENIFNELLKESSDFQTHPKVTVKYATMLVERDRVQDAVKSLLMASPLDGNWTPGTEPPWTDSSYRLKITAMLSQIAERKDVVSLKLMQETLISRKFAPPAVALPSLIKYYVDDDNLEEAITEFGNIVEEYRITPGKEVLTIACINKEETEKIEKIIDISSKVHGDMNTLFDLAVVSIELGKLKEAAKIFQTPGLRILHERLYNRCEFLLRNHRISELEGLVTVTKGLFNVNRQKLYDYLLESMISENDHERALGVWLTMQEEGVDPSNYFLSTLNKFLLSKGLEVPFVVPSTPYEDIPRQHTRSPPQMKAPQIPPFAIDQELTRALDSNNWKLIEDIWERVRKSDKKLPVPLHSRIIGFHLRNGRLDEAVAETKSLLLRNEYPSSGVMKKLITKLADAADVATIEFLGKYMDSRLKLVTFYDSNRGKAYMNCGRTEEFINTFFKSTSESSEVENGINKTAVVRIMEEQPEFYPLLKKLAEVQRERGDTSVYTYLWDIHFSRGETTEAEEIYEKCMKELNNFLVNSTCLKCFHAGNTQMLEELLKVVDRKTEGREKLKGKIFSTYVNILNKEGKHEEALKIIEGSLQNIKLEYYERRSLSRIQKTMEKEGLTFPYDLSSLNRKSEASSSSTSSSDEAKHK